MDWEIRLIKLITGETLVSNIRFDKLKKHAVLKEPLAFNFINKSTGSASVLTTRWLETDKSVFTIKTYHIITVMEPTQFMHDLYLESIEEMNEQAQFGNEGASTADDKWDDLADYMDTLKELEDKDPVIH
tara:strand:+ start:8582 stop:8971 length:390 start_codon:yes stop_codon:yes gene_type:complete